MGNEILYCEGCRGQLRAAQFEKRSAIRFEARAWCLPCAEAAVPTLPSDQTARLSREIELLKRPASAPAATAGSSARHPRVPTPTPAAPPSPRRRWAIGAAAIVLAAALAMVARSRSGGTRVESPPATTEPAATSTTPRPSPSRPPPLDAFAEKARALVEKAKAADLGQPPDPAARLSAWEEAARAAEGTGYAPEAHRALEAARRDERDAAERRLDLDLRGALEREDFGFALRTLEGLRSRYSDLGWASWIEERRRGVLDRSRALFESVRDQAASIRRNDPAADVTALRDRVLRWGVDNLAADFDRALPASVAVPPLPPPVPEPPTAKPTAADTTFALACRHALARSYRDALGAVGPVPDLARDAEELAIASQAVAAALDALAKAPKEKPVTLRVSDAGGGERQVEGWVTRTDAGCLELKTRAGVTLSIPVGEVLAPTLTEVFLKRAGAGAKTDSRTARLLLLLEGWAEEARAIPAGEGPEIAAKYWAAADGADRLRGSGRERAALKMLWQAEDESDRGLPTLSTLLLLWRLSQEYGDTVVFARNRAHVTRRLDQGRDYAFGAEDLRKAGAFARSATKAGLILTSEADSPADRRGESFVELEFLALPEAPYRCWAYVGGCCAETLTFFAQGSDFAPTQAGAAPAEPGSATFAPVKHALSSAVKTHAAHGGRKQPSRWGWVEVPLPHYAAAGMKTLRLVSDQQGFSVGMVVVSSLRTTAPGEAEHKKLAAARPELSLRSGGPPPAVWWDFDTLSGKAFADRGEGTLPLPFGSGATAVAGGIRGQAASFDGTGFLRADRGKILNSPDLTVTLWIRPAGTRGRLGIISSRADAKETPFILCQSNRSVHFEGAKGVSSWFSMGSPELLSEGTWTHVGVVCKGGESITLYVDGKVVASKPLPEARLPWSQGVILGSESWGGDPPRGETPGRYRGLIDEVKMWARCLRPEEIDGEFNRR